MASRAIDEEEERRGEEVIPPPVLAAIPSPQVKATRQIKHRIIELFATFHRVKEVQEALAEEFGVSYSKVRLAQYQCDKASARCSAELQRLFWETRERYLRDVSSIGIASQAHRLQMLDRIAYNAVKKEKFETAMAALKQAAEEVGGIMTNRREVAVAHLHLSAADAKLELATRLGAMLDAGLLLPSPDAATGEGDKDT